MKIDTTRPNIVMIVLDTHRRDRISAYGYDRETTPNLDQFAQDNTLFKRAISPAQWTIPAHASMFTGEYPTTHQTLQPHAQLDGRFETLAQLLSRNGYQTTGFCNNPLLGVLNNGLKRGFDKFYNYCGAVPSVPERSNRLPPPIDRLWAWYTQQLRKLSYPVQNAFANSDFLFQAALHPKIVPWWIKVGNFKGNTADSIHDAHEAVRKMAQADKPQFVFLNLMETHSPFWPPDTFIDKFAPYFKESREARDVLRRYNAETLHWMLPLDEPLEELKLKVINDLYDAEVNYQDYLLGPLLEQLNQTENTLVIVVADHGEGIGDHDFMGHSFVAYQELVHVPLLIKFPDGMAAQTTISDTVSTRRLFHTILNAAHVQVPETAHRPATDVRALSLNQTVLDQDPEQGIAFAEAYPPDTFLFMVKKQNPALIDQFHCNQNRWAVYQNQHKLARIDGVRDELFDVAADPQELHDISDQQPEKINKLSNALKSFLTQALTRQPDSWQATQQVELDENVMRQLRALGYLD